jgi:hydroxyacylglutathione hydrolase
MIRCFSVGQMSANCFIVSDDRSGEAVVIDPGDDGIFLAEKLVSLNLHPKLIIATHGHFDHIMAATDLQLTFNIPFVMHKQDEFLVGKMQESARYFLGITPPPPPVVSKTLSHGDPIEVGTLIFLVVHTPGHTPGSICLAIRDQEVLFTGDTVFAGGGVGRSDFSYSDPDRLAGSIRTILSYPDATRLYPGHGDDTDIRTERKLHGI